MESFPSNVAVRNMKEREMIGYFINMILGALVAIGSYWAKWWFPAVIFPIWIFFSRATPLAPEKLARERIYAMRFCFYIFATAYMIGQAIIFQINVGSWYGWLIGLFIGFSVGGLMAGKLEPLLMHREIL